MTVFVPTYTKLHLQTNTHPLLLEMITSVTQLLSDIGGIQYTQMIPYGMELHGCGPPSTCCSLNNPPWFLKQLPSNTADDIEMRMCRDHPFINGQIDEDTPIEMLELYIH